MVHGWYTDNTQFSPACSTLLDTSLLDKKLPFVITEMHNNLAPIEVSDCNINTLYIRQQITMNHMGSSISLELTLSNVGLMWLFCYSVLLSVCAFCPSSQILKPLPVWQVKWRIGIQISKIRHFVKFHENSRSKRNTPIRLLTNVTTNFTVLLDALMNLERVMTHLLTGGSVHGCQPGISAGGKNYRWLWQEGEIQRTHWK